MYTPPPSATHFDFSLILEWFALISLLAFGVYCTYVIKNEKVSYKKEASWHVLGSVKFLIAKWWNVTEKSKARLSFNRGDTHYDWEARFELLSSKNSSKECVEDYLKVHDIFLDDSYGSKEETTRADYLIRDEKLLDLIDDFYRLESIGTKSGIERIYLDIVSFRLKGDKNLYLLHSTSSILNGCVEGPYFEEAIKLATKS